MRTLSLLVLLTMLARSSLDVPLAMIPLGSAGGGVIFNIFMVLAAIAFFIADGRRAPLYEISLWGTFIVFCALLSIHSPDPASAIRELLWFTTYAAAGMLPYHLIRAPGDYAILLNTLIYSACIPIVVCLYQIATNYGDPDFRLEGTLVHPNILAFYILVILAASTIRLRQESLSDAGRLSLCGIMGILIVLLFFTKTRSAWIGGSLFLVAYVTLVDRSKLWLVMALAGCALLVPSVQDRIFDATAKADYIGSGVVLNSYEWRTSLWARAMVWIVRDPVSGHGGLHTFFYYSGDFAKHLFDVDVDGMNSHNIYVKLLFEVGVFGLALFIGILLANMVRALTYAHIDWPDVVIYVTMCVVYALISYSDNILDYLTFNWYFWFLVGTIGAELARVKYAAKMPGLMQVSHGTTARSPQG